MKIYLDIETATPLAESSLFAVMASAGPLPIFLHGYMQKHKVTAEEAFDMLALNPQYGIIHTIAIGYEVEGKVKIKSITNIDERALLKEVLSIIDKKETILIGHALKDFDLPFILRRALKYRLPISYIMPLGKKPWESTTQDTKEKWKMGSYMNTSSLKDICACLNIPTPKDDISGKDVSKLFWNGKEKDLIRINKYCAKDVLATMAVDYIMEQAGEIMDMPASYEYIINNKSI